MYCRKTAFFRKRWLNLIRTALRWSLFLFSFCFIYIFWLCYVYAKISTFFKEKMLHLRKKNKGVTLHPYLPKNGHFPLYPKWPLWRGSAVTRKCKWLVVYSMHQKLDYWIIHFKSFHWLSHHGAWAMIPCSTSMVSIRVIFLGVFIFILFHFSIFWGRF